MIALLVFVLLALVMGALIGTLVARDSGYVLVAYDNLSLETSVWFALLALVVLYFLIRLILMFLSGFLHSRLGLKSWNQGRLLHKSRTRSVKGLLLLEEGNWLEAKKALVAAASRSETPLVNYLAAARAADKLGELSERDNFLRMAHESTPGSRFAVGLVQSQLQLGQEQWEAALATLRDLNRQSTKHAVVLKMLAECYQQLEDWNALTLLIVDLRNQSPGQDGLNATEVQNLEMLAWSKLLRRAEEELVEQEMNMEAALPAFWDKVPKKVSMNSELVLAYVNSLLAHDLQGMAESVLVKAIKHNWHSGLAGVYGRINGKDDAKQLHLGQAWLKQHPDDPALLMSLGRISMRSGAWDQAREYFEASLRIEKTAQIYAELGRLCLATGEDARGRDYMTQAMILAGNLESIPLPEKPT